MKDIYKYDFITRDQTKEEVAKELEIYKKINFLGRFEELGRKYNYNTHDTMDQPDIRLVQEMLGTLGYKPKYYKSDKFYRITEKFEDILFRTNIVVRDGFLDMMMYIYVGSKQETGKLLYGDIVQRMAKFIKRHQYGIEEAEVKVRPSFQTYEELEEILKEAFLIYEDLKAEVIRLENLEKNLL